MSKSDTSTTIDPDNVRDDEQHTKIEDRVDRLHERVMDLAREAGITDSEIEEILRDAG